MRLLLLLFALTTSPTLACELSTPCPLADRSYHLREPDEWDGQSPLPVLLHFHGWGRQGDLIVNHDRIASATRKRGVLLVAPNGIGHSWSFWSPASRDTDFAEAVLADLRQHYPIDESRIYVSGYSYGSAMAWRFACETDTEIAALLSISGTIDQSTDCTNAPSEIHHVHGLDDTVMNFPFGPGGDTTFPVALWRRELNCATGTPQPQWQAREWLTFTRTAWDCPQGNVTLDTHPGGHFIPHGWIARQLDTLFGLPPTYP